MIRIKSNKQTDNVPERYFETVYFEKKISPKILERYFESINFEQKSAEKLHSMQS